jgi:putative transposase
LEVPDMLSEMAFSLWCDRLQLSPPARHLIQQIRSSDRPVRRTQSRVGNWRGAYPSRKVGKTIQFESRTVELPAIHTLEHNDDVLEYYDQPSKLDLSYHKNGRPVSFLYTPDFFVLRSESAGWEEWKAEEQLVALSEDTPNRYQRDEQGQWRCPPGEVAAAAFGLTFHVHTDAELHPVYVRNLRFLEDYLHDPHLAVDPRALQTLRDLFAAEPVLTLGEVLSFVEAQQIYSALLLQQLSVDLKAAPFADPDYVYLYRDQEVARAYLLLAETPYARGEQRPQGVELGVGHRVIWDSRAWTVHNLGMTTIALRSERGDWAQIPEEEFHALVQQGVIRHPSGEEAPVAQRGVKATGAKLLAKASPEDYAEANRKAALLKRYLAGETPEHLQMPYRTLRDWEVKWQQAEQTYGHGYLGLLDKYQRSGNLHRKLDAASIEKMHWYIEHDYETDRQKGRVHAWGQMVLACQAAGIHPPSYKTFCQEIKRRSRYEQTLKRKGRRAAYQVQQPEEQQVYLLLDEHTPRHGDRPFEIVHLDHTEMDIALRHARTGRVLGKPWATFLVDAYSRRVLVAYLTYDPPSYRTDMMVLRECVRRYHRLPQTLIVDGGSDFNSTYFETLLAMYDVTKLERPGTAPRAGAVLERLFGTTNTSFVNNLLGNTQASKVPRQTTPEVDPRRHARWTLGAFYRRLCEWCYEVYDQRFHPTLEQSPREAFEAGMLLAGVRPSRLIDYDETFLMMTLPTTAKGTAKVVRQGVKIHYEFYWSDAFRHPEVLDTEVPVRFDPYDVSRAFAFVRGQWVQCMALHHAILRRHSERELKMLSAELRQRRSTAAKQYPLTIAQIAEFLASVEAEEQFGVQRLCDEESREILQAIDASYVTQFPLFQAASAPVLTLVEPVTDEEDEADEELETYGEYS